MGKYIEDFCRKIPKLVLTFALFISLTSNTVSADNTNNSTKETDSVILEKEATPVPGSLNEWEIDLKVKIKSKILTQDIVLVIDKSASMESGNKILEAKRAAKAFINTIIPTANTGDNRIAIVSFGSRSGVEIDFTKDSQQLNSKVDGIFTSGATMMQGGLRDAELLLNNSTADRKIIVFLGDGAPTNTYELSSIGKAALDAVPLSEWEVTPQTKTNEYWEDSLNKVNFKNSNYYKLPLTHGLETTFNETHYNYSKIVETTTETSAIYDVRDGVDLGTAAGIRNYEKAKVFTYNLYSAAIAQANIAKSKGISIHAVALDLGKDPSALHTIKNVADPGNFYQASGNELVEIFKQIAASIVLPISDITLTDPMGEGFTISSDVAAIVGSKDGLVVENNTINWSMSAKNFKFNPDTGYYEMHIRYKVKLNNDAIGALNNSTDGRIPTNGNANLSYTDDKNKDQVDSFPVPQVVPTIIEITKKLFDENNVEQSLQDQTNQRSYQYELKNTSGVLKSGSLNHTNPKEYYIPYTEEALTITETGVVNDNIDRFETKYFLTNASNPRAELVGGSFDVVSNTGMNTVEINNTAKKNFVHDFSVAKNVTDSNGDGIAERGEILNYSITVTNNSDKVINSLSVKDEFSLIKNHVDFNNGVSVKLNGVELARSYTIENLMSGIDIFLNPHDVLTVDFKVTVKNHLIPDMLENTAYVGDKSASATIETGQPIISSKKNVVDANGDGFATPGEVLNYTLTANNSGTVSANSLLIKDDLSSILAHVDVLDTDKVTVSINDVETGSYTIADLKAGFSVELKPGDTVKVSFLVTVKADLDVTTVTSLKNIATVGETTPEVEIPTGKPLIESNKSVIDANGDGLAAPGEILTYTLNATNKGTIIADALLIKDDLSSILAHVDVNDTDKVTVSINDVETGTYTIADLKAGFGVELRPGETVKVSFSVTVKTDLDVSTVTGLKNIATVGETTPEVEIPTGKPQVESNKAVVDANGDGFATPGETISYKITAINKGKVTAENIIIKDDLSGVIDHVDTSSTVVTINNDGNITTHTLAELQSGITVSIASGKELTASFSVTVKADLDVTTVTTLKNIATVGETTPEVEIPTGKPQVESNKAVVDANGDGFAAPGEALEYTLTATNKGTIIADSLLIKDDLANVQPYVDVLDTDKVTVSINDVETGTYTIADLKSGFNIVLNPGETVTVGFSVTVKADLDVTTVTSLKNIATVGETTPEVEIPTGKPQVESNKAVVDANGDGFATPGEVLNYTLSAINKGKVTAENIVIKDDLSGVVDHVDTSNTVVTLNNDGNITTHTLAELQSGITVSIASGKEVSVTFSVTVKADLDVSTVTSLKNIATVGETTPEVEIPTGKPQVESNKAVVDASGDGFATPGEVLNYTLSAINKGKVTAENIIIKDDLSDVIDHVDTSSTVVTLNNDGNITTHTLAELQSGITVSIASGKEVSVTFSVTVKADLDVSTVTSLKNIATVGETTPEVEIPTGKPQVESNKAVVDANGDGFATPGETISYKISAINKGKVTAENIIIKDDLSGVIDHVDTSNTVVTLNNDGNITTHTLAELQSGIIVSIASGKEVSVTFSVTVKADLDVSTVTSLKNIATVGETTPEVEIPTGKPLIESNKTVVDANGDGLAAPGEVLDYTLTATNKGDIIADALHIKDDLSSILTHVDVIDTDKVTVSINDVETGTYTIADLKAGFSVELRPGETVTVSFKVTVKADLDVSTVTSLKNIATVGETTPEVEIPTGKPQVESNKAVVDANGDGFATPGEVLNYTLSAINKGKVTAENIIIKDDLSGVINHVDTSNTVVTLNNDGNITTHTLAELQNGITVSIASGKELSVTFSVTVKADLDVSTVTSLKNIATVGETTPEVEIPTGKPQVESNKAVVDANGDGFATPGEVLNYTLSAINKGKVTAENIIIKDDLSGVIDYVDTSNTVVTLNNDGNITTHTLAELQSGITVSIASGKEVSVTFSVTVKADLDVSTVTTLKNIATVGETTPEVEIPTGKPLIDSNKAVGDANGDGYATPGEVLDYTLTATNKGDIIADALHIKDDLSSILAHVDVLDTDKVTVSINDVETGSYTIADLKAGFSVELRPGETVKVSFSVTVKADLDVSTVTTLKNIATVGETTPEVEIPTGKPLIESNKAVVDANGDGYATPGEVLDYTLTATNKGDIIADALHIKDDLSSILTHVDVLDTDKVTVSINDVEAGSYTIADLKAGFSVELRPGETVTVSFTVTVKEDLDVSTVTTLKNIATVGETTPEVEIPTGKPVIESNKAVVDANGDGFATPGEVLDYTLTATNKGDIIADALHIKDDLANVQPYVNALDTDKVTVSINGVETGTYTIADLKLGFSVELRPGETVTVSFTVTVKEDLDVSTVTSLKNIATIGETTPEVEIPTGKPVIESNKTVVDANGDGFATPGEVLDYTLTATNKGDIIADALQIKDDLANVQPYVNVLDTDKVTVSINDVETGSYTIADLKAGFSVELRPGETVTVSFTVTVKADLDVTTVTSLKNLATVGETTPEVEIPTGKPVIESNKAVADANGDGFATPGEVLGYTLTATNKGDIIADGLLIKDDLSSILAHVDVLDTDKVTVSINDVETGSYTIADLKAGFSVELRPGETVTVSFTVTVKADLDVTTVTTLKNIATVGETTPEVEIPTGKPQVESNKIVVDANGDGFATPGEVLNYTLTATNKGDIIADGLLIKDDLSSILAHVDVNDTDKVTVSINDVETGPYTIADLKAGFSVELRPGETVTVSFTVTVKVDLDVSTVTTLKNIATVGETTPEVEIPTGKPQVESNKTVVDANGDGFATPGEVLDYTLTATNKGDIIADALLIKDDLSSILDHVDVSDTDKVTVSINDVETGSYTITDLKAGFSVELRPGETVTVSFSVTVKADLDV